MTATTMAPAQAGARSFYVWMAVTCTAISFAGFAPTYWLQLAQGTFAPAGPLLHLHGLLFSIWMILYVVQTSLAASGRIATHRSWGLAGVSLGTALVLVGSGTAIASMNHAIAAGQGEAARAFLIVPLSAIAGFAVFFTAAIVLNRRPEAHKRLMLVANITLIEAALARFFFLAIAGGGPGVRPGLGPPPPVATEIAPHLICAALIGVGAIYDWRTRGRPHWAYVVGIVVTVALAFVQGPVSLSPGWQAFAEGLSAFGR